MSLEAPTPSPQPSAPPEPSSNSAPDPQASGDVSPTILGGGVTPPAAPAPQEQQDWRARLSGGDAKSLERLSRYKTEGDVVKALFESQDKLRSRPDIPKLMDNATPEQVAEYRKAMGVPGDGTLDAYGIKAPDGYAMTESETGLVSDFVKLMHGKHAPVGQVKEAVDFYFRSQAAAEQQVAKLDIAKQKEWQTQLRDSMGRDFEPMVAAGEAFLTSHFAETPEIKDELLNARLPGGGRLGDHPAFIGLISDLALQNGFTDRIEATAMESGGKSLEQQQTELEKLQFSNPTLYNDPATQAKLDKIIGLRLSKGEIDSDGNPVRRRRAG